MNQHILNVKSLKNQTIRTYTNGHEINFPALILINMYFSMLKKHELWNYREFGKWNNVKKSQFKQTLYDNYLNQKILNSEVQYGQPYYYDYDYDCNWDNLLHEVKPRKIYNTTNALCDCKDINYWINFHKNNTSTEEFYPSPKLQKLNKIKIKKMKN